MTPSLLTLMLTLSFFSLGLHPELLNQQMMGLSNDTIAVMEVGAQSTGTTVRFFDAAQGKPMGEPFTHSLEIKEIQLSQVRVSVLLIVYASVRVNHSHVCG